jgi:uncharacterized protein YfaS (alpha-2-macroglobulin family)
VAAATGVPNLKPGSLFPSGLTNEPLAVVTTSPADKSVDAPVGKGSARIIVQFNHPVVPLVSVEAQKSLPQPLTIVPAVKGGGEWINTSTYAFTPAQDLSAAETYSVSVQTLTDMLGQSLSGYAFGFKTSAPTVTNTFPENNTVFAGPSQPITVTFNTAMDTASVESRFVLKHMISPATNEFGPAVGGKFDWQGPVMRFTPDQTLEYDANYVAQLAAGAQDANKQAATGTNTNWTFRTVRKPDVASTTPRNGDTSSREIRQGLVISFTSPMDEASLKVTVVPTVANQSIFWDFGKNDTMARISGDWLASQAYEVTIGGESVGRYGDKMGKNTVLRFTAAPLDPALFLNVPGMMGMYDVNGAQLIYATHTNLDRIDYSLYRVDRSEFLGLIGSDAFKNWTTYRPAAANKMRDWSQAVSAPLNAPRLISTTLATGGPLPAGVYYLEARSPTVTNAARHLLVVTGVNLALKRADTEALVWVTDLKSGKPVANQMVSLYGPNGSVISSGKSDSDGIVRATYPRMQSFDQIFALSESDGHVVAAVGTDWNNGISSFDFQLPVQYQSQEFVANLYTERPIYRAGQTVYFKGILRRDTDAQYSIPGELGSVPIKVRDNNGREIYTQSLPLSSFGTFNGEIKLGDNAETGYYDIGLELGSAGQDRFFANATFIVAEYRAPEYQVDVKSDKNDYANGDTIKVDVNSTYFFGGPVGDAKVTWRLLTDDLFFSPDNITGYWSFEDTDLLQNRKRVGGVIREGTGTTDKAGNFHFETPADLSDYPLSQNFTLEAEITDINGQAVANRITVPVHKGRFYIGMRPQVYVGAEGKEQNVDLLTVNPQGTAVASQTVSISVFERQWYNVRQQSADGNFYWTSGFSDTLVTSFDATTDAQGKGTARFTPSTAGIYRIAGEATDSSGNKVRSATYLWVAGGGFVNWKQENNDRFDLVPDKKQYAPGDTAEILIPAPFAGAEGLLTIERGSIREVRRLTLEGNSEKVLIPIRSDYAPNVFVSVMLVKGRAGANEPAQFKMGYVNLPIATVEKELDVSVTADKAQYAPGEKATFNIAARTSRGDPVEAEFSVAVVDKAVESLATDLAQPLLQAFYGQRGIGVQTSATLMRSVERVNQTVQANGKGGGGGGAVEALPAVRRNFSDTAFWNSAVKTDAAGKAQVSVVLPDNLTTWSLTAKGVTGLAAGYVGEARVSVISTKDLLLRPVTPRFFVVGDQVRIEAVINNNSDKDLSTEVRLDAQGLTLNGSANLTVPVKAHDKAQVSWDTVTKAEDKVVVKFTASGGSGAAGSGPVLQDAVEYTLPIVRPLAAETVATAGEVTTKIAESIQLPANADRTAGELQIETSPSLAAASRDSLTYLESFDYDCTEQAVSRFFPNAATYAALTKLGLARPELKQELEANMGREVQRLYTLQNNDGGWGWWRGDDSRPMLTAYALLGLNMAKQSGFNVAVDVMNRGEQSLVKYLEKRVDAKLGYAYNERAFVIFALTEMGRNYTSRAVVLFDQRANLGNYGKAYLLMVLQTLKLTQAQTLQTELTGAAILNASGTHWEEATQDYWTMNTNTRSTAVVIMALTRASKSGGLTPLLGGAVRWLMTARLESHWATTQETAWSVLALTEYMQASGELAGNFTYQVLVNGKMQGGDVKVDNTTIDQPQHQTVPLKDLVVDAANELLITRGAGDGKLYYSANLRYYLAAENLPALNKGIIVGRQYYAVDQQTLKPSDTAIAAAKVGEYVQVKLAIVAPTDLYYLALEDPLPAGFEAVDTTLKTTSVAAQGGQLKEQGTPQPGDPWFRPYWSYWANTQVRDDKVALFATYLGRGTYEYTYLMRASVAGTFRSLPARAWEMYFPEVMGRSEGARFQVLP